ncbi:MAG: hypothetical protein NVSMB57_12410 [Actinomycetota bacterium]
MAALKQVDLTVTGEPSAARDAAVAALQSFKFRIKWTDEWNATAERGNKILNAVAGAIAQYFKVGLRIFTASNGQTVVQLLRESRGAMGGAIGMRRTTKNMERLRDDLAKNFTEKGILMGVKES